MPQPYNYALNVPNPADALTRGLQTGVQIGEVQAQTQLRDQQAQALAAKAQRQQQFQQSIGSLGANPSAKQLSALLVQFPEMSDLFKESYNRISTDEQKERTSQASSVYTATLAGDTGLAVKQLNDYAAAYRNSGREDDAKALEAKAKLIELHPEAAERGISLWLAETMGPEKFAETFGKLQDQRRSTSKEGAELTKAEAEAQEAVTKSGFAESLIRSQVNLNEEQVRNLALEPEFKRANLKILTLQAAAAKETNELKKQELQDKLADAQSGAASIDNLLNTADKILKLPVGMFSAVNRSTGPVADSITPTWSEDSASFQELVKTLGSQAFLSQIPTLKGMGALSNAEGEKLQSALANLSLRQGDKALFANIREAQRLMLIARKVLATKYGVDLGSPNTPNAAQDPNSDDINALVGGAVGRQ